LTLLAITARAASPIPLCSGGNGKTLYYVKDNQRGEPMYVTSATWRGPTGVYGIAMVNCQPSLGLFVHVAKSNWSISSGEGVPMYKGLGVFQTAQLVRDRPPPHVGILTEKFQAAWIFTIGSKNTIHS
jgi:hypothetical protein